MPQNRENLVVLNDMHCGSRSGLIHPDGVILNDGAGRYMPSEDQLKVYGFYEQFIDEWVPDACKQEPFDLVLNGDLIEGHPFSSTHQISTNPDDQKQIAMKILTPICRQAQHVYFLRGTEVHVGMSGYNEEALARAINAECKNVVPNKEGCFSRYDLWIRVGDGPVHFLHHIGTTGSSHYESTAILKEYINELENAARWGYEPPRIMVRAHRHLHCRVDIPTAYGNGIAFVNPGWQSKTPYTWRIPGGRVAPPQFGGAVIRQGRFDLYALHFTKNLPRTEMETVTHA